MLSLRLKRHAYAVVKTFDIVLSLSPFPFRKKRFGPRLLPLGVPGGRAFAISVGESRVRVSITPTIISRFRLGISGFCSCPSCTYGYPSPVDTCPLIGSASARPASFAPLAAVVVAQAVLSHFGACAPSPWGRTRSCCLPRWSGGTWRLWHLSTRHRHPGRRARASSRARR